MQILLFDTSERKKLFPLSVTRAIADIRMGILTIKERWQKRTGCTIKVLTTHYLQHQYDVFEKDDYLLVNAAVLADDLLISQLLLLPIGSGLADHAGFIGGRLLLDELPAFSEDFLPLFGHISQVSGALRLEMVCQIFQHNKYMIDVDYQLMSNGRSGKKNIENVHLKNEAQIFIEESAQLSYCVLNAEDGPIYIGKNALVMEGCFIRGPFSLGDGAVLKMGSKIYGATTLGPGCTGGGEIKNTVMMGYSNKAHDGYLGDSVIGEWCNLGAGTCNSNIKNTAGDVKIWNYYNNQYISAGTKCGLIMGDYSRTSINTAINTGTVVGVCCNVFGDGLTPKLIPDFTWGTRGLSRYEFDKALKDILNWMKLKQHELDDDRVQVLKHIFDHYND